MSTKKDRGMAVRFAVIVCVLAAAVQVPRLAAEPAGKPATHKRFDYRTCAVQYDRVTFVNGVWIGKVEYREGNTDKAVLSCPRVHEYLHDAGDDGWELVACYSQRAGVNPDPQDDLTQTLFLKKEK